MNRRSTARGIKGRIGVLAVAIMLCGALPAFGQHEHHDGVNVVDQKADVINGPGVDQSNESNNNRTVSQEQNSEVNDEDRRSVTVDQSGGDANAEGTEMLPGVAVASGPVLSPPVVVANNDILSNKNKTTHVNQSQSYEDNSEFSDDHSRTVINESFNKSPGSTVSIGRRHNSDVIVLGDREFSGKKAVSFDLAPAEKKALPRTGAPEYTFWLLAAAMLSIVFGMFLEYSGWRAKNGLRPAWAVEGYPLWEPSISLPRLSLPRLSLPKLSSAGSFSPASSSLSSGLGEGVRGWTESVLLARHLAPAGLAPDDSVADRADRELFALKVAILIAALLLAFVLLGGQ